MADRIGHQLGNYRLIRLLGQGGFAEIYLGEHMRLHTQAALKVLQTRLASTGAVESFQKEACIIAPLMHPHIVRILDFDVEQGIPLVMDYAPNGTLRQRHPRGERLPLTTIVSYVEQIAEALQYAHDQQLIHRDIKPENLLLGRNNEVLLSDFGTALLVQSIDEQSREQQVVGTVTYMAPERIEGRSCPASDQYGLGVIVYEWLCGTPPFQGSTTEVALQHTMIPPPPLCDKLPGIWPDVEQVVMTALAKDPQQRFGNVRDFADALKQSSQSPHPYFLNVQDFANTLKQSSQLEISSFSEPTIAPESLAPMSIPTSCRQLATPRKRKPGVIVLLLLALLVLIGTGGVWIGPLHPQTPRHQSLHYPNIAGTYNGIIVDITSENSTAQVWLSLQQNQGKIRGVIKNSLFPDPRALFIRVDLC